MDYTEKPKRTQNNNQNDFETFFKKFGKWIIGLITGTGVVIYLIISTQIANQQNCVAAPGGIVNCTINSSSGTTSTPTQTIIPTATISASVTPIWTSTPATPTSVPPTATLPSRISTTRMCNEKGDWAIKNPVFELSVSNVNIQNVGWDMNRLIMDTHLTNLTDDPIGLKLHANFVAINENMSFGPELGMSKWPDEIEAGMSISGKIATVNIPNTLRQVTLEFLGVSVNGEFFAVGDEQLNLLGIPQLTIGTVPSTCTS